jgi:hypothetical protein
MSWLWPIRTGQTFFDVWTVCHLCFWVIFGFNAWAVCLKRKLSPSKWLILLVAFALSFVWEGFEGGYLESHGWVMFQEVWFNRWVSDPLMALAGTAFGLALVKRQ